MSMPKINKLNPTGTCKICGFKIFNRQRNSIYCKECAAAVMWIDQRINGIKYNMKEFFPYHRVELRKKLTKVRV